MQILFSLSTVYFILLLVTLAESQSIGSGVGVGDQYCPLGMRTLFTGISCTSDQTCQNMANGYFCMNGYCCAEVNPSPSGYGSSCTYTSQCLFANSACQNNICYCRAGYDYNGDQCVPDGIGSGVGVSTLSPSNCSPNQVAISGICYSTSSYSNFCRLQQQCSYPGGICLQGQCTCPTGWDYIGDECIQDSGVPTTCLYDEVPVGNACCQAVGSGGNCIYDEQCILETDLKCVNNMCVQKQMDQTTCDWNQVQVNGQCYPIAYAGQACVCDEQCNDPYGNPMFCGNGICENMRGNSICQNGNIPLQNGNAPFNCLYQYCSPGYQCEYNNNIQQYICCSLNGQGVNYGQVKMYLNTNMPLRCTAINSCIFVDYPHCVYSQRYGHNVCCSTRQCS